ncbi:unnamed protein product, partial [Staurois parvus]
QLPFLGSTFITIGQHEESAAENRHLHFPLISVSLDTADHVGTCTLSIRCRLSVRISATCQCPSVLPIRAVYQCQSVLPISATYQCRLSVPYVSAAFQCPSVMPVNAHQCHLPVPPHQCHLSVAITAA